MICNHCGSMECWPLRCRFSLRAQNEPADYERENAYVEATIRCDQSKRIEGSPELDMDIVGRALRAGT